MASNRINRPVIVSYLLSAVVLLGGCSPPLPKALLLPADGTISIDRWHAMAASPLTTRR